jgi:murein L,D-transpeptidase YafK
MKINYPNKFDQKYAMLEGRDEPGTNIFLHGKAVSVGCLAMGDIAIEELFVLVAKIGVDQVEIAIAPSDPRKTEIRYIGPPDTKWINILYANISRYFENYRRDT